MSIPENEPQRIPRFEEESVLAALREAFSQRPDWRDFDARQLAVLLFLYGYLSTPPEDADVKATLPCALEDLEGAA